MRVHREPEPEPITPVTLARDAALEHLDRLAVAVERLVQMCDGPKDQIAV